MRPLSLVLMFAACGGRGDGAVLSFTAPDGPAGAARIELVLASAGSDARTTANQRMRPGILLEESVVYYRQRSSVDAILGVGHLDGFEVRIEPDQMVVEDERLIPFALIFDAQDALIGVGTVNDGNGIPSPVLVKPGTVASYDITVVRLAPDTDDGGVAVGQGHAIVCEGQQGSWPSGAVWRSERGPQIRLLLPDVSKNPDSTDAMARETDLDCDLHAADERDCDDLRAAYHPGQTETCDGADTDCDGRLLELIEGCAAPISGTCSAPGVQLCTEGTNSPAPACVTSAACGCVLPASDPLGCHACELDGVGSLGGSGPIDPCAPAVGKILIDSCQAPGCSVDVVGADGPWEIEIGPDQDGPFSARLTHITAGYYFLHATYLGSSPFPPNANTIGGAYIAITGPQGGPAVLQPINLELAIQPVDDCQPSGSTGDNIMRCRP